MTQIAGHVILRVNPICEIWHKVTPAQNNSTVIQTLPTAIPSGGRVRFEKERGVTEVEVLRGIGHITVRVDRELASERRLELLHNLAAAKIPVFLVKLLPDGISFAIRGANMVAAEELLQRSGEEFQLRRDLAMVSIIAGAMRDLSGIMAIIYEALVNEGILVRQTGDAYNAVHCLVPGVDAERAARALRQRFDLGEIGESVSTVSESDSIETVQTADGVGLKSL